MMAARSMLRMFMVGAEEGKAAEKSAAVCFDFRIYPDYSGEKIIRPQWWNSVASVWKPDSR